MQRRDFITTSAAAISGSVLATAQPSGRLPIRKGVELSMLPKGMSFAERFQLAKDSGFECIECGTVDDDKEAEEIKKASEKAGLPIHSVMNRDHWQYPLSSPDAAVVDKSVKGMDISLKNAKLWGASTVLLVPAVVNPEVTYQQAWTRSHEIISKRILPKYAAAKIIVGIEEVWNKFLLSPLEFATYVDSFKSPWAKAYCDVGNMVLYGYPQDWVRTLGKRICKVHLKDFSFRQDPTIKKRVADFVNLRDGDIDWKELHKAFAEIGYKGDATVELNGGDATYLKDVVKRFDMFLDGV